MRRCIRLGLIIGLALAAMAIALPAQADDFEVEPLPGEIVENPPPPPIPQQDTGNSGTGELAEGEEVTAYPCVRLAQQEWAVPSSPAHKVQWRTCFEQRDDGAVRQKVRASFFFDGPVGRVPAYGNVGWTSPAGYPAATRRMYKYQNGAWSVLAYTQARASAIQVHTSVGYSQWGCTHSVHLQVFGRFTKHYVRTPIGSLYGPFNLSTGQQGAGCLP